MTRVMMDWIDNRIQFEKEQKDKLSYKQWVEIRRFGTPEEIEAAVERMAAQGGYDNLV